MTPLHRAARAGDAERVSALLSGGADVTVRDSRGRTPYLVASSKEVRDAFRWVGNKVQQAIIHPSKCGMRLGGWEKEK